MIKIKTKTDFRSKNNIEVDFNAEDYGTLYNAINLFITFSEEFGPREQYARGKMVKKKMQPIIDYMLEHGYAINAIGLWNGELPQ